MCYRTGKYTAGRRVRASLSPETVQAGAVKELKSRQEFVYAREGEMLISVEMMRLMAIVWTEKCFGKLHALIEEKPRQEFVLQEKARCFYQWKWCDWWQLYATPVWTEKCFDRLHVYVDSREKVESSYPQEKARWFYQRKWCDWWKLYATWVSTEKCFDKLHAFIEKKPWPRVRSAREGEKPLSMEMMRLMLFVYERRSVLMRY